MNRMQILLEQLQIEEQVTMLKTAKINRVVVNSADEYRFYIGSYELIDFEEYCLFLKKLSQFPYPASCVFEYENKIYQVDLVLRYVQYFIHKIIKETPQWSFASELSMDYQGDTLTIFLVNQIQMVSLKTFNQLLEAELKIVGIDINVSFSIDKENEEFLKIKKAMETESYQSKQVERSPLNANYSEELPSNPEKKSYYRSNNDYVKLTLEEIDQNTPKVKVSGYVFKTELTKLRKSGKYLQTICITDYTDSITIKRFERGKVDFDEMNKIGKGNVWIEVTGQVQYDSFSREVIIQPHNIQIIDVDKERKDLADIKRVELHTHTKMSTMDGISTISEYIGKVASWGHKAIAVTDHGNVQSFPEAQMASKKHGIKMIYGIEMNVIDPVLKIVDNVRDFPIEGTTFVCFDLETTGLSVVHDRITEFGAVKVQNGSTIETFQTFINPEIDIPSNIAKLTGITNEMVKDAPTINEVLPKILDFFGDDILVAHNASFDISFLNEFLQKANYSKLSNTIIDSLNLARAILKPSKSYRLGSIARSYRVDYDEETAHRADYDARVLGDILNRMLYDVMDRKIYSIAELNNLQKQNQNYKLVFPYHSTMIALNKTGLKNMFKLVTEANTTYYSRLARIPKELIDKYREGLLIGSSCYRSDVFEAALNQDDEALKKSIEFYDYIEIQPLEDYYHLVDRGKVRNEEALKKSIIRLIDQAEKMNKIIVGTGDVHFADPKDKIYRDVFISNPSIGISNTAHPLCDRRNPKAWTPNQYLRTTNEFLDSFANFLPDDKAYEYVVTNTNKIADMVESFNVVHDKLYPPFIEGADENLRELCYETAYEMYGNPLPNIVRERLSKELENIIKHGFGVIYYISHKLVKKSNDEGYLVGSRGSVGSSFVATMSGITEVNPLQSHYRCPQCKYSDFLEDGTISVANGFDLPDKKCPKCNSDLIGDGHNIPFETFLGFDADKVPDIDLNFSGEYQAKAHEYTKTLFGEDKVYRAGTISTVADKTAFGYARGYKELAGTLENTRSVELERIAKGCTGVKRTTGQHPGGIIVIPNDMDVYDFTPVQYPADDLESLWKTTHFDFHAIHDNVLKLDILGHVDPTVIRMLQDRTGVNPKNIPMNDEKVISLFSSTEALGIDLSYIGCKTGALGLPEFGTNFVRGMLEKTNPKSFSDLVIISGLSHGTDVYLGNAELLIQSGTCTLSDVIGCRDDIMVYLMAKGVKPIEAFKIMEFVRKGLPSKDKGTWESWVKVLKENNIDSWYIDSCAKIKYMFPKAHAVAYVTSAVRVAWWKVYHPAEYYAVYFTARLDTYDVETMVKGKDAILLRKKEIEKLRSERLATKKDEDLYALFDICLEMYERGISFSNIDLNKSDASQFVVDPDDVKKIIPPFTAIDGLGEAVAETVVNSRNEHDFLSKEDVIKRTKLNNTHIKILTQMNVFKDIQEENQLTLFTI